MFDVFELHLVRVIRTVSDETGQFTLAHYWRLSGLNVSHIARRNSFRDGPAFLFSVVVPRIVPNVLRQLALGLFLRRY